MRSRVGPGGDDDLAASQRTRAAGLRDRANTRFDDLERLEHAARAGLAAGLVARRRDRGSRCRVERSVATFACVAALAHISRFIAGTTVIGASVARHSVVSRSSARPCARRAMKSAEAGAITMRVRPAREFDVPHRGFGRRVPEVRAHGPSRQRLERQRRDELLRAGGHHDLHVRAALREAARELGALVRGDAARDARAGCASCGEDQRLTWRRIMAARRRGAAKGLAANPAQRSQVITARRLRSTGARPISGRPGRNSVERWPWTRWRIGGAAATAGLAIAFVNKELLAEIPGRAVRVHVIAQASCRPAEWPRRAPRGSRVDDALPLGRAGRGPRRGAAERRPETAPRSHRCCRRRRRCAGPSGTA